ncbi:MFS transporter [Treponema sp. TIM-1]|uniref:MFS transporter n=1 Tax=Treponema sp. TIM-1 TaxID=2898417 RepID=UPI00397F5CCA
MKNRTKLASIALLWVLYAAYTSIGLQGTLLGTAWPVMYRDLNLPLYYAGVFQMVMVGATVIANLLCGRTIRILGSYRAGTVSAALIALGLLGFCLAPFGALLFVWSFVLGYGTGLLDTSFNNFTAIHYQARYVNWLHCFFGAGAALSPLIMSYFISHGKRWQSGYFSVSMICWGVTAMLLLSFPLWKRVSSAPAMPEMPSAGEDRERKKVLTIPGVKATLLSFFCEGSILGMVQVWAPTYLTMQKGLPAETAGSWISAFFIFIVVCRLIIGIINEALPGRTLIRLGCGIMFLGCVFLFLPGTWFSLAALVLLGFGMAPVVPSIIHETPIRFGAANSSAITGYQFAVSNIGAIGIPAAGGFVITNISMTAYPFLLFLLMALMTLSAWWDALPETSSHPA